MEGSRPQNLKFTNFYQQKPYVDNRNNIQSKQNVEKKKTVAKKKNGSYLFLNLETWARLFKTF